MTIQAPPPFTSLRAMSLNLFAHNADWPARRKVLQAELAQLRPDVLALQEAITDDTYDQAAELLGEDYHVVHQTMGLLGDGRHHGASVASRWPILTVHEVDLHLTARTDNYSCGAVIAEVAAPELLGRLLVACHGNSWAWWPSTNGNCRPLPWCVASRSLSPATRRM